MKVVIWGHKLHSHTHSYIHAAFYKAFKFLGYETYWLDNSDTNLPDFTGDTLFLTENQVDEKIPKLKHAKYILHNCNQDKYLEVPKKNILAMQVYTNNCLQYKPRKLGDGVYYLDRCVFQPWATDLLPNEIDLAWADIPRKRECHWIGTIGSGKFGNVNELAGFQKACAEKNIKFNVHHNKSFEENLKLIQESYLAPAIEGTWQCAQGYIACRLFKNISYGQLGLTNCSVAWELLETYPIYAKDTYELFYFGEAHMRDKAKILELMKLVRDKHTYLNRIKVLLELL